jgi:hypothetical protein
MAKRFKRVKARARTFFRSAKKASRRKSLGSSMSPVMRIGYGMGYGFLRGQVSNVVNTKIAPMLPFGQYSDEVVFGLASYLMAKSSNKTIKSIGQSGLAIEGALLGNQLGQSINLLGSFGQSQTPTVKIAGF